MTLKSLDPRVTRLELPEQWDNPFPPKSALDQFETYEAFVQIKENKPLEHVGPVHAPNEEMAFLFAKEQYSRRGMYCNALCIIKTEHINASHFTDNGVSVYDSITSTPSGDKSNSFEVFHLVKRGKQHKYVGTVEAKDPEDALAVAKVNYPSEKPILNVWVVNSDLIFASDEGDLDIWETLKEKQYREAIDYRGQDKIKAFKQEQGLV